MSVRVLARTVHGVEWVAADEVTAALPAARDITLGRREVTLTLPALDPALLGLRTVDDAFLVVGGVDSVGTAKATLPGLAAAVAGLDWTAARDSLGDLRELAHRPAFDVVASIEGRRAYSRYAVEEAVGGALAHRLPGRHLARTPDGGPAGVSELTVRVFLRGDTATVALRLGEVPLHRRGYKQDTGAGTLHPPMAAVLVRLVGAARVLLDPCCGDGTIAIEAALADPAGTVLAADLDPQRLAHTRSNADRAGVPVHLARADAGRPPWRPHRVDAIVTNPPWGVAVGAHGELTGSLRRFWQSLPGILTAHGRACVIADADLDAPGMARRSGYPLTLATQVRLAGRVSHVVLCAPPGQPAPALPAGARAWRQRALAAGVVTETGF